MRCVVCGAPSAEECNQQTHDAHYRMWQRAASQRARGDAQASALRIVSLIEGACREIH